MYNGYAFQGVGIAPFIQHSPHDRNRNTLISNAYHRYIDIRFPILPIGTVKAQKLWWFFGQQTEYYFGNQICINNEISKEPLDAPHV